MIIDFTKTGVQNVIDQINYDNNTAFTVTDIVLGLPSPRTPDANLRNTVCSVTSATNSLDSTTVRFTRLHLTDNAIKPGTGLEMNEGTTLADLKAAIVAQLNLVASDVTLSGDITRPPGGVLASTIQLTANSDSYLYVGEQDITLNWIPVIIPTVAALRAVTSATYGGYLAGTLPWKINDTVYTTYPAGLIIPNGAKIQIGVNDGTAYANIFELVAVNNGVVLPIDQQPASWTSPDASATVLTKEYIAANLPDFGPPYYAVENTYTSLDVNTAPTLNFTATTLEATPTVLTASFNFGVPPLAATEAGLMVTPGATAAAEAAATLPWKINGTLYTTYPAGLLIRPGSTIAISANKGIIQPGAYGTSMNDRAYVDLSIVALDGTTGNPLPSAQQPAWNTWTPNILQTEPLHQANLSVTDIQTRYPDSGPVFYPRVRLLANPDAPTVINVAGRTAESTPRQATTSVTITTPGYHYSFADYAVTGQTVAQGMPIMGIDKLISYPDPFTGNTYGHLELQAPLMTASAFKVADLLQGSANYTVATTNVALTQGITTVANAASGPLPSTVYNRIADVYADLSNFMFPKNTQLFKLDNATVTTPSGQPAVNSSYSFDLSVTDYRPGTDVFVDQVNWVDVDSNGNDLVAIPTIGGIVQNYNQVGGTNLGAGSYTGDPTKWLITNGAPSWSGVGYQNGQNQTNTVVQDKSNTYIHVKAIPGYGSLVLKRVPIPVS